MFLAPAFEEQIVVSLENVRKCTTQKTLMANCKKMLGQVGQPLLVTEEGQETHDLSAMHIRMRFRNIKPQRSPVISLIIENHLVIT